MSLFFIQSHFLDTTKKRQLRHKEQKLLRHIRNDDKAQHKERPSPSWKTDIQNTSNENPPLLWLPVGSPVHICSASSTLNIFSVRKHFWFFVMIINDLKDSSFQQTSATWPTIRILSSRHPVSFVTCRNIFRITNHFGVNVGLKNSSISRSKAKSV